MRTAAYEVDVAMRPPQARVSQAKLFVPSETVNLPGAYAHLSSIHCLAGCMLHSFLHLKNSVRKP